MTSLKSGYNARWHWLIGIILITTLSACGGSDSSMDSTATDATTVDESAVDDNKVDNLGNETIIDTLYTYDNVSTFLAELIGSGLDTNLNNTESSYTVFVPNDEAFEVLGDISGFSESELNSFLLYHILADEVDSGDILADSGELVFTENNQAVAYQVDEAGNIYINDAQIIIEDIEASNGVIHIISAVLTPKNFFWSGFDEDESVEHESVPTALFEEVGAENFMRYFYAKSLGDSATDLASDGDISGSWYAVDDDVYPYQIWIPDTLSENMPVSLLLHTRGEQGDDNVRQIETDLAQTWSENIEEATIIIAPQAASGTAAWSVTDLDALLNSALEGYNVDEDRFYISGHSFGGRGTLNMLNSSTYSFAAAAIFAPSGNDYDSLDIDTMSATPQWYIASEEDRIVDYDTVLDFYLTLTAE